MIYVTVGYSAYVGRPLVPHSRIASDGVHNIVLDSTLSLGEGKLIGFTFLSASAHEVPDGIEIIPAVRLQIWEELPPQGFIQKLKLVLEERVELNFKLLGQNITVSTIHSI